MTLLIDNEIETSLEDFIKENTAENVEPITEFEIQFLHNMSINEVCWFGFSHVKRIN